MIPYGRQDISQADIKAVVDVLNSDYLTQGPVVPQFEKAIAHYCGAAHAVAVNSATSALHIACMALDVGLGDIVWTVPNTFVASANCARYCGAEVAFVDIDPTTGNLCNQALTLKLEQALQEQKLPKVIIPVHFGGASCDLKEIHRLVSPHGIRVIEDASHAIGGSYDSRPVGCCQYSDMTVFSFHPVKIITSAEGGMVTTQDSGLAKRLNKLRSHGVTRDPEDILEHTEPWYYEQQELGYNYRMTELQAALGLSQMSRLSPFVERRNELAKQYVAAFEPSDIEVLHVPSYTYSAYHLFVIQVDAEIREALFKRLRGAQIGVNVHYIPVHWQPDFAQFGFTKGSFPHAERYYQQAITLPLHPNLTDTQQLYVIEQVLTLHEELMTARTHN